MARSGQGVEEGRDPEAERAHTHIRARAHERTHACIHTSHIHTNTHIHSPPPSPPHEHTSPLLPSLSTPQALDNTLSASQRGASLVGGERRPWKGQTMDRGVAAQGHWNKYSTSEAEPCLYNCGVSIERRLAAAITKKQGSGEDTRVLKQTIDDLSNGGGA
jgi:hypothetical protein